ncbi:aldo/keto reductase [Enterococcus durans]|uniref:L-glyceraldehyde 3-phosphate reductase n=2 Tax=Enterococcus durans TaxID=53345 RepID=A0A377L934_9ENTE|nr:aldo/keto reductase [Enterococcus durans]HCB27679.1 L-glyceraldehyde 3-phosphate reductase [Enterococcus sp.]EOT26118.1 oxidoreductase, aldo/keto reductase [Enterococcus durans ATCC 6056]EOU22377.1 oxidoreductase, aldo/keto reductase [Enterococcus durans ATCC 6056]MDB1684209.1 aldo/keto reductase [Enterococcus durans]PEH45874.1 L-glyceraldehyde 3-phosphate reductase [Enterococcus durans]
MYVAKQDRYEKMTYRRTGKSGLKLPLLSLGLWQNFGDHDPISNQREILRGAFDMGITHFDLANNYGGPAGAAEKNFGRIFKEDFTAYRDEMIISNKAGYHMWEGPYGEWGSRKSIIASCDQSLQRMGIDYVDIFYHHRPDPETPLEETAEALIQLVRQGKALYVGISNYNGEDTQKMTEILRKKEAPFIIHQMRYNMFSRELLEDDLAPVLEENGLGAITFSPLAQGLLTKRYLNGIPEDSRAHRKEIPFLSEDQVTPTLHKITLLQELAETRNQSLAQMALAWNLRQESVTSVLVGASRLSQLQESVRMMDNLHFSPEEEDKIETILQQD